MKYMMVYGAPFGQIGLVEEDGKLVRAEYLEDFTAMRELQNREEARTEETQFLTEVMRELNEYFSGVRTAFTVPLKEEGTDFQKLVWAELRRTPYGSVRNYAQVAEAIGHPKAAQAVGQACKANPIAIFTPCHRIIKTDGTLGSYSGGLRAKYYLLMQEGVV